MYRHYVLSFDSYTKTHQKTIKIILVWIEHGGFPKRPCTYKISRYQKKNNFGYNSYVIYLFIFHETVNCSMVTLSMK